MRHKKEAIKSSSHSVTQGRLIPPRSSLLTEQLEYRETLSSVIDILLFYPGTSSGLAFSCTSSLFRNQSSYKISATIIPAHPFRYLKSSHSTQKRSYNKVSPVTPPQYRYQTTSHRSTEKCSSDKLSTIINQSAQSDLSVSVFTHQICPFRQGCSDVINTRTRG
jgi:hypothetical protein